MFLDPLTAAELGELLTMAQRIGHEGVWVEKVGVTVDGEPLLLVAAIGLGAERLDALLRKHAYIDPRSTKDH